MQDQITYDGFGNVLAETNPSFGDRYKFTAREFDSATGLQYNRARYYDPAIGRWTSQDPLGFDAGDTNLYRYVRNDPLQRGDSSGLRPWKGEKIEIDTRAYNPSGKDDTEEDKPVGWEIVGLPKITTAGAEVVIVQVTAVSFSKEEASKEKFQGIAAKCGPLNVQRFYFKTISFVFTFEKERLKEGAKQAKDLVDFAGWIPAPYVSSLFQKIVDKTADAVPKVPAGIKFLMDGQDDPWKPYYFIYLAQKPVKQGDNIGFVQFFYPSKYKSFIVDEKKSLENAFKEENDKAKKLQNKLGFIPFYEDTRRSPNPVNARPVGIDAEATDTRQVLESKAHESCLFDSVSPGFRRWRREPLSLCV